MESVLTMFAGSVDVPHEADPVPHLGAREGVVASVDPLPDPEVRGEDARLASLPHDLELLHRGPPADAHRLARRQVAGGRDHGVEARPVGHEAAVVDLTRPGAGATMLSSGM